MITRLYGFLWVKKTRFGDNPYTTTKRSHVELKPFPPGTKVYVKVRHIPSAQITSAGRR